jgi:hypothetical protein
MNGKDGLAAEAHRCVFRNDALARIELLTRAGISGSIQGSFALRQMWNAISDCAMNEAGSNSAIASSMQALSRHSAAPARGAQLLAHDRQIADEGRIRLRATIVNGPSLR